jgi:ribosomal protein L11 methyltransferase
MSFKTVTFLSYKEDLNLDQIMFDEFGAAGKLEMAMDEASVDKLLGDKAYCSGNLDPEILDELASKEANQQCYYFLNQVFSQNESKLKTFLEEQQLEVKIEEHQDLDWNESWKSSYQTIRVSDGLEIVPSWEKEVDLPEKVFIYPGQGFGTGTHETTFMCLSLFERADIPSGARVLDFGCGSGILGIAAIKKKRALVDFVDIDVPALDNCLKNLELNEIEKYRQGHALVLRERFKVESPYSLVFANILEYVLIEEKQLLLESMDQNSHLIISGVLNHQLGSVLDHYPEFELVESMSQGDWSAAMLKRK